MPGDDLAVLVQVHVQFQHGRARQRVPVCCQGLFGSLAVIAALALQVEGVALVHL